MSFLSYQHFPIYSVMALFLGAFLIVLFGRSKFLRNLIAFLATAIALGCMIMLIKPVMLEHEIICYWMGNRAMAGGYAMGIAMEVDQVSLFFGLLISTAVFVACVYSLQYMEHDDNKPQYYTLFLMLAGGVMGLVLSGDLFEYYDSWRNPVLRELAPLMPGATPGEIAKKIYVETSAQEVRESLDFLTKTGLLKKKDDGTLVQSESSVKGATDATRLALRGMHRQMSELATPALDLPKEERNFSGVTMGVSRESYARIVDVLNECRKKIIAIAGEENNVEQVYRVNLQLFPLTRNLRENENA